MTNQETGRPVATGPAEVGPEPARRGEEPPVTTLVLVRHGVTAETGPMLSGRRPGVPLSDTGREQAARAAERIAALPVAVLHSSPIERCAETAGVIAERIGVPVSLNEGLLEADYGEWAGRRIDELAKTELWRKVQSAPSTARFPGGESLREMQSRIVAALEELAAAHPGEIVVAVSHADPIKAAAAHFAGTHLDLFQRLFVAPASTTVLRLGGPTPVIVKLNDLGGLDDLRPKDKDQKETDPPDGDRESTGPDPALGDRESPG
ncbi:MAG: MSMEG_4193 family putative phosphomutase [Acidimicrobiia bacterium]